MLLPARRYSPSPSTRVVLQDAEMRAAAERNIALSLFTLVQLGTVLIPANLQKVCIFAARSEHSLGEATQGLFHKLALLQCQRPAPSYTRSSHAFGEEAFSRASTKPRSTTSNHWESLIYGTLE